MASGSELFDNDTFDCAWTADQRPSERVWRYSFGDFGAMVRPRSGRAAARAGDAGRDSKVRNQSLATGFDRTIGTNMTADFRVGYFKYKVAVLPFDYGTSPATDAGILGLNLDNTFTSGLFGGFVEGPKGFNFGFQRVPTSICPRRIFVSEIEGLTTVAK